MGKEIEKIDGYTLTDKLRKTRRRHNLSAPTQALYYELVAICNEEGWVDEFRCSNNELCLALCISEKSLWGYRNELIQAGLISYRSGKSKRAVGEYSFNGCKIYNQSDNQSGNQSDNQSGNQSDGNASDNIEDKTKTETETLLSPDADAPGRKKTSDPKKLKKNKKKDPPPPPKFWQALVDEWFRFNEEKYRGRPSFKGADPGNLRKIVEILEKRAAAAGVDWTEESAVQRLRGFLETAYQDEWMRGNFLLWHLDRFIDKFLLNQNQHGNSTAPGTHGGRGKTSKGGTITDLQALKRNPKTAAPPGPGSDTVPPGDSGEDWTPAEVVE